jgi:hypothetical protein
MMVQVTAHSGGYKPDDDEVHLHPHDGRAGESWFAVGTGYGVGEPHFYVWLEENGGERGWWLDPDQAIRFGERLLKEGRECLGRAGP